MPRYDFRCTTCGSRFELSRTFNEASDPAACPHDGAAAVRLFSPPLDLLMYNREPVDPPARVTIPPGALSCHDHGPPPDASQDAVSGSHWHTRGYDAEGDSHDGDHPHEHGHSHAHGHSHDHPHGHSHHAHQ